jgi:hypothetical protein
MALSMVLYLTKYGTLKRPSPLPIQPEALKTRKAFGTTFGENAARESQGWEKSEGLGAPTFCQPPSSAVWRLTKEQILWWRDGTFVRFVCLWKYEAKTT